MNPIAQRLTIHSTALRCNLARRPLKHQRYGQKPPRNSTILHTTCTLAQFLSAYFFALNLNPSTHNSLPLQMNAARDSDVQQFGNPKKQANSRNRWYNALETTLAVRSPSWQISKSSHDIRSLNVFGQALARSFAQNPYKPAASRNTLFMRVCHPGPLALNLAITS